MDSFESKTEKDKSISIIRATLFFKESITYHQCNTTFTVTLPVSITVHNVTKDCSNIGAQV